MPENSHLVVLTLLFSAGLLTAGTAALAWTWFRGLRRASVRILEGMGVVALLYVAALVTFSLTSQEKILARDQWKVFCEVDCHLAYSVQEVTTSRWLGEGENRQVARGIIYRVKMKLWFDETTITEGRGNEPLRPEPRNIQVVDNKGRSYAPLEVPGEGNSSPMELVEARPLQPGDSRTTELFFELPSDITNPLLLVSSRHWIDRFILGHEQSPFHRKIFFELATSAAVANK